MVREDEIRRQQIAQSGGVGVDVTRALFLIPLGEQLGPQTFVAVEDEDGEQPIRKLRPDDFNPSEVELLGVRFLRDDDDLVPGAAPLARERARVDVDPVPLSR